MHQVVVEDLAEADLDEEVSDFVPIKVFFFSSYAVRSDEGVIRQDLPKRCAEWPHQLLSLSFISTPRTFIALLAFVMQKTAKTIKPSFRPLFPSIPSNSLCFNSQFFFRRRWIWGTGWQWRLRRARRR